MTCVLLDISLPADRLQAVYRGQANRVLVTSRDGRRINLPAHHLRRFMTHSGVHGTFELEFDDTGRLLALRRLA
ncbi:DUF2835 domain-containing protein [Pseudomonas sp. ZM23]|uniref:DUF2835 domain-containing protein n=1 Tax=Pseudomonas triclosanedens TaxID=2961893 RepID=A0ABY6ZTW3_9PSED|nr:DUF2835 domain-containing protein [Pseudomonas triclosanedens]MCP8466647.1 DUF2835 domain-containing protein [Pseudomonas triclosanedens]MCP8471998.1 DUF2835 domain-containing protein [Pseudomonas triclosanedens]MCP8474618.1 DUF2835 domain-containing protein [Pseudomonas triclosanedens]WAI48007.1 DUF2835 domain-containing protein [Pseudomonas triclosanedens]